MRRRAWLFGSLPPVLLGCGRGAWAAPASTAPIRFPQDFGAHPESRTEWWYATGSLQTTDQRRYGFQITFFRTRTPVAPDHPSRFAAGQIVFAHAALTDLAQRRLRHDERIARSGFGVVEAATGDTRVVLLGWTLARDGPPERSRYAARVPAGSGGFGFDFSLAATQPPLLQGIAGVSRKGPHPEPRSHYVSRYYSEPQLAVDGTLKLDGKALAVRGKAWLDHEWSDAYLPTEAVGWDWVGMNLDDGAALMAFRMRRRDGSTHYAGGSFRRPGETGTSFGPDEVHFTAGRRWVSSASKASYPVEWTLTTPAGRYTVRALLDDQELDSRRSTGAIYWEGLSELLDAGGLRVGGGYLEMTGYAGWLAL